MVLRGEPAFEVVHDNHADILDALAGILHHADAPIDVGTIAIAEVVEVALGQVGTGIEGLMADQHAMSERTPRQSLTRGLQTAMAQESS